MKHEINRRPIQDSEVDFVQAEFSAYQKQLEDYIDRLLWWNKKINLVSRDVSRETLLSHTEHSLIVLISQLFNTSQHIIDAGTGGGLPGIPLAITRPSTAITLNDIVSKKITACKHMASVLKLDNIKGEAKSIEKVILQEDTVIVSKHAFKINDLIRLVQENPWKGIILLKGGDEVEDELNGIQQELRINVTDLYPGFNNSFYKGKALIEILHKI